MLLTASCSSPTEVVLVVVVLPLVEPDTGLIVVVDTKIIVSMMIVAIRWMLRSSGIFLLRLFSVLICLHAMRETKDKRVLSQDEGVKSKNVFILIP